MSVEFFPIHWTHDNICAHALKEILENQRILLHNQARNQGEIMSVLTDVQVKLAALGTLAGKLKADVDAFIEANSGGASDADLTGLAVTVDSIGTILANADAAVAPTTPAQPPAPAPTPIS